MKKGILSLIILGIVLCGRASLFADDSASKYIKTPQWITFKDNQITLMYQPDINLKKLEARLHSRYFSVSAMEENLFSSPAYRIESRISARLESILLKVKQILAMNPPSMILKIKVFKSRNELNNEYFRIFNSNTRYKSFYVYGLETIYTSMQDITDSVIAHEMSHAVLDHYFNVIPPPKVAEFLAVYVDSHLERE